MKNKIIKNKYFIISICILFLFILINFIIQYRNFPSMFYTTEEVPICNNTDKIENLICVNFKSKADPLIRYYQFINDTTFQIIIYIAPLFVIIPSSILVYRKMKNGYMKNTLTRIIKK